MDKVKLLNSNINVTKITLYVKVTSYNDNLVVKPWSVDDKEPTTSIQIRLNDGSRLVAKFNLTHTVAHIRDFIRQAKDEDSAKRALQLSGFPPEKLDDDSRIIGDGLKGCVVQQK